MNYIASIVDSLLVPRAYRNEQIGYLQNVASQELGFSIRLAATCGLRAVELDTISRASEITEDRRDWVPERFVGIQNSIEYVVTGKGGLRRKICVSMLLADELEHHRLPTPIRKISRGIHYMKLYGIVGGHNFSQQFSRLSFSEFSWSTGAHGLRHRYQLRDLRAKAGTDTADASGDIRTAQKQLGHKNLSMTEHYIKKRRGDRVNPTR
ncbi:tyrosine-type recombinase/integrase [Undibacterium sp. Rencai35W]|uniref:tyrosine-type recombinase/integrase n=1 Tax=Undibacterium sp. Rencai35W TaxID=3413046 RepID=UPI003BF3A5CC